MHQRLNEIKSLLASHGLNPKRRLGQHFLHDHNHLDGIVRVAEVDREDLILEVGPGTGALSVRLLEAGAQLVAVEIDVDFVPILRSAFDPYGDAASLLLADVLTGKHQINREVDVALCAMASSRSTPFFKLVSNLPYQIAAPLLANLVCHWPTMTRAVVTIQREVADRLTAAPGTKAYGPLSVIIQAMCRVQLFRNVAATCFWPIPKVDSAIVCIDRRDPPLTDQPSVLAAMVHQLFTHRRKQLSSIQKRQFPGRNIPDDFEPTIRPEQLTVEQLIQLCNSLG